LPDPKSERRAEARAIVTTFLSKFVD
jgi:hypothetical protein